MKLKIYIYKTEKGTYTIKITKHKNTQYSYYVFFKNKEIIHEIYLRIKDRLELKKHIRDNIRKHEGRKPKEGNIDRGTMSMKDLKVDLVFSDKRIKSFKELEKKRSLTSTEHLKYLWTLEDYNKTYTEYHKRKNELYDKKTKLADELYKKYETHSYGMDYPPIENAIEKVLEERGYDEKKVYDMVSDFHRYKAEDMDSILAMYNWREDLIQDINDGLYPELKGKFIPQQLWRKSLRKDMLDVANDYAKNLKEDHNVELNKKEINAIKIAIKRYF